jgi:hypothetical protein
MPLLAGTWVRWRFVVTKITLMYFYFPLPVVNACYRYVLATVLKRAGVVSQAVTSVRASHLTRRLSALRRRKFWKGGVNLSSS